MRPPSSLNTNGNLPSNMPVTARFLKSNCCMNCAASSPATVSANTRSEGLLKSRTVGSVDGRVSRSEEHTSELQSLMRISYAVFCLKKKKSNNINITHTYIQ